MKKCFIFTIALLVTVLVGCKANEQATSQEQEAMKYEIAKEAKEQIVNDNSVIGNEQTKEQAQLEDNEFISEDSRNNSAVIEGLQLNIPESYHKANHNNTIYVYDSKGNSLIISNQAEQIKVDEYSEKDSRKLITSGYKNALITHFEYINIDGRKTIKIQYSGSKDDKEYMNCRYYIENGENTILIDVQATNDKNYQKLKSMAETIVF